MKSLSDVWSCVDSVTALRIQKALSDWNAEAVCVTAITPDASLRRYFRVLIHSKLGRMPQSVVAMVFDSVKSPEAGGDACAVTADYAYVELSKFFHANKIPVPELYLDARSDGVLLLEDLGNCALANCIIGKSAAQHKSEDIEVFYRDAIDTIASLQKISHDESQFFFNRSFTKATYLSEMMEFWDYLLKPLIDAPEEEFLAKSFFEHLAGEISSFPMTLVHRDFHSWNLLVDDTGKVRVIDFQDALLGPMSYDLVGLLNDRDTDVALGDELYVRLLEYFIKTTHAEDSFLSEYDRVLLQRDLKVAGRFSKLSKERGLVAYKLWIPGTLRRIGCTLERITALDSNAYIYVCFLSLLEAVLPDVMKGARKPLRL